MMGFLGRKWRLGLFSGRKQQKARQRAAFEAPF
jgi:hypothetical protein